MNALTHTRIHVTPCFYHRRQHFPEIIKPPQLTTTDGGMFTSSSAGSSQSRYSTSNFYKRV